MPMSRAEATVEEAVSLVWRVESTRWPVRARECQSAPSEVARLTHEDDVGVLAEKGAQAPREGAPDHRR